MKSLNEIVAELRMGDDGGKPAYRIGRADKVEVSMPSGTPVRSYVIECVTIKELADWIEAAVAREREPGNAAAMREALELAKKAICNHARANHTCASLAWENSTINANCGDILCAHRDLCEAKTAIQKALSALPRNCDAGTAEEQEARYRATGELYHTLTLANALKWAQMPYEKGETK